MARQPAPWETGCVRDPGLTRESCPSRARSCPREPGLATAPTTKAIEVPGIGDGLGLASAISGANRNLSTFTPRMDAYGYAYGSRSGSTYSGSACSESAYSGSACRRSNSASSALDGPFKFFATPHHTDLWNQRSLVPDGTWIGLPPESSGTPPMWGPPPTAYRAPSRTPSRPPPLPSHHAQSFSGLAHEAAAASNAAAEREWLREMLMSVPTEPRQTETNSVGSMSSVEPMEMRQRASPHGWRSISPVSLTPTANSQAREMVGDGPPATTNSFGDSPLDQQMATPKSVVTQPNPPPVKSARDAPPPRLLGRGMNCSVRRELRVESAAEAPRGLEGLSVHADKPVKKLASIPNDMNMQEPMLKAHWQEPMIKTRGLEVQEPTVSVGTQEMQLLKSRLDDAQLQLSQECCNTQKLERDMERVQALLSSIPEPRSRAVLDQEQRELAETKARIERVETLAEEEGWRLRDECVSASSAVESLRKRLADVEANHEAITKDNMMLQRHLEDHKAHLDSTSQRCLDIEENSKLEQAIPPPTASMDAAEYEERLAGHEQHLKEHGEQLVESEKVLQDLQDKLKSAEAERDNEKEHADRLLQRQEELVLNLQVSQRNNSSGAAPIHQYQDFKTVRGYRFTVKGEPHKIEVAHHKGRFQLALDGETVGTLSHSVFGNIWKRDEKRMDCKVTAPDGQKLDCVVRMDWKQRQWEYTCSVNHAKLPHCWQRLTCNGTGHYIKDACWEPPEVAPAATD